ncbi:UvrD-helicase domain-containing protein [Photobacterium sp. GB-72]|uniref:UvrD-helicase domain-containing protein n=1 Tax=Photobacterium sp. GB-72 TaxID=2022105 RepID=UPI000D15E2ED|nr:UvrD-helicase domain-containing protein [Photobacterium sp. GB-72]PSV30104.1 ATP-dependent helicase [Photobacterium sp. GB-72]
MTHNEIMEIDVQKNIYKNIDDFNSFIFNAGAGAGKTYALIETLKYVIINKISATQSPQKVACVTYTNVAVNEIKNRLGNTEVVNVSTIHERLWELIKRAQPQLLQCHKEKIEAVINQNQQKLISNTKEAKFFNALTELQRQEFIEFAIQTKDFFYQSNKLKAAPFKMAYKNNVKIKKPEFLEKTCLSSAVNFKYVVKLLYKNDRLQECLKRIDDGKEKRVNYDSKVNTDRLHRMKFSHDTLLEYGLKLVKTYPILCRIIIDTYPYFFIDEYQDTHSNVVKFVKTIHDYAIKNNKQWMVGYFGDTAQSIYEDGVGRNITVLHDGLDNINKIFNRRSHQQIIDVVNNIRDDEIVQKPIFDDRNDGYVRFYYNNAEDKLGTAKQFIAEYKSDLTKASKEEGYTAADDAKIHCLVLTNRLMASFNGFESVYDVYNKSTIYYNDINTQVLSHDLEKLHPTVLTIYYLIKLYQDIQKGEVSYYDVFGTSSTNMTFSKASLVIRELENKDVASLNNWIDLIINRLENSDGKEELGKLLVSRINYEQNEVTSPDVFRSTLLDSINTLMNEGLEDEDTAQTKVDSVLALPMTSLINWANFIDGIEYDDISYHTYHGTKGEEYKNVAIILEHSFGKQNTDKFKNYFNIVQKVAKGKENLFSDSKDEEKHINTQNLLYVACSRAIKNLRVLYLDDISDIESGINTIFGESKPWPT